MLASAPLDNTQTEFPPLDGRDSIRSLKHQLRGVAGRLLLQERVAKCGRAPIGGKVDVVLDMGGQGGARYAGLETCGSVWHCPVCAAKIAEGRRREVDETLSAHEAAGGETYMLTLTVPHYEFQTAAMLKTTVATAWRKMMAGAPWGRIKARCGVVGYIRALEVSYGRNGWHPHLHVLLLVRKPLDRLARVKLKAWTFCRWSKIVTRLGLKPPRRIGYRFERAERRAAAGDYVGKWGVDAEIAKAHTKKGRNGSKSPWQLLADAGAGDARSIFLFREYARAFKGARQLTWSIGLRDLYRQEKELSDYDLACLDAPFHGDAVIGSLRRVVWFRVVKSGLTADVLSAAESDGWQGVLTLLREHRLALPVLSDGRE